MEENMKKIRNVLIVLWLMVCMATSAEAQVSIGIGLPNVSIGINLPLFPELVPVPGYPVYYAPRLDANYFFYDGMYWVYLDDNWYASSWYNGPWSLVVPEFVPLFILRVPVSYYRQPPMYFRGWQANAPPRWGHHWGPSWEQRRSGWDRWKRSSAPAPAPLPVYQKRYSGDRYPRQIEQQTTLRSKSYRYQPRDKVIRQHFKQVEQKASAPAEPVRQATPPVKRPKQQEPVRSAPPRQRAPIVQQPQQPQHGGDNIRRTAPVQPPVRQRTPADASPQPPKRDIEHIRKPAPVRQRVPAAREQRQKPEPAHQQKKAPKVKEQKQKQQDKGEAQEPKRGRGQEQGKDDERGQGRNR
jgi:hypothetical protein